MRVVDVVGAFMAGIISIAALSLIVQPNGNLAGVITSFGSAASSLVSAAM